MGNNYYVVNEYYCKKQKKLYIQVVKPPYEQYKISYIKTYYVNNQNFITLWGEFLLI